MWILKSCFFMFVDWVEVYNRKIYFVINEKKLIIYDWRVVSEKRLKLLCGCWNRVFICVCRPWVDAYDRKIIFVTRMMKQRLGSKGLLEKFYIGFKHQRLRLSWALFLFPKPSNIYEMITTLVQKMEKYPEINWKLRKSLTKNLILAECK